MSINDIMPRVVRGGGIEIGNNKYSLQYKNM
jgi:hypothetical protein